MYSDLPHIVLFPSAETHEKKIQAIKDVRSATKLGLKESKEVVDRITDGQQPYTILYASDYGAYSEDAVRQVHAALARSPYFDRAELCASVRAPVTDKDALRGVSHQAAVLATIFAAEEGDLTLAFSKVSTLATVTQAPTFKAAVVILSEAMERIDGRLLS